MPMKQQSYSDALPVEIVQQILSHLSLPTLFAYARTSRASYDQILSTISLANLTLAILPKRLHGVLAVVSDSASHYVDSHDGHHTDECGHNHHQIILSLQHRSPLTLTEGNQATTATAIVSDGKATVPKGKSTIPLSTPPSAKPTQCLPPSALRAHQTRQLTTLLSTVFSTSLLHLLPSLTLHTYPTSLTTCITTLLTSSLPHLKHLTLNFRHPYVHDPYLPAHHWENTPSINLEGSPAWNALAGLGDSYHGPGLAKLERLVLRRAAVTRAQLSAWVTGSRGLRMLELEMVAGVDVKFLQSLLAVVSKINYEQQQQQQQHYCLEEVTLRKCPNLGLVSIWDLQLVMALSAGLKRFEIVECEGVDRRKLREAWEAEMGGRVDGAMMRLVGLGSNGIGKGTTGPVAEEGDEMNAEATEEKDVDVPDALMGEPIEVDPACG